MKIGGKMIEYCDFFVGELVVGCWIFYEEFDENFFDTVGLNPYMWIYGRLLPPDMASPCV